MTILERQMMKKPGNTIGSQDRTKQQMSEKINPVESAKKIEAMVSRKHEPKAQLDEHADGFKQRYAWERP